MNAVKVLEYIFDDYYCCEENKPTQVYGLLGVYRSPETIPVWCPKKTREDWDNDKIKYQHQSKRVWGTSTGYWEYEKNWI